MSNKSQKIKVMHVLCRLETGGLENGVVNICNNLDRDKFEPVICCLKSLGPMAERLKPDVKVFNLCYCEGKDLLRPLKLAKFFKKARPDIVHTHAWGQGSFEGILGAWLGGVPIIVNGEHGAFFTKKYQIILQRFLAGLCKATLSVSQALKNKINETLGVPLRNIKVIVNGVDLDIFHGNYSTSEFIKEIEDSNKIKIDKYDFIIGCIGSLKPQKNQEMLLRAIAQINKNSPKRIIAIFVGSGIDLGKLRNFVNNHGLKNQVIFLGERKDISRILSAFNVLVSCSTAQWEGLSNVILEAMASGKAVISTRSVGSEEIIKSSENGFLINCNDVPALVNSITDLISDLNLLSKISHNAKKFIADSYSLIKMVNSYQRFYSELKG